MFLQRLWQCFYCSVSEGLNWNCGTIQNMQRRKVAGGFLLYICAKMDDDYSQLAKRGARLRPMTAFPWFVLAYKRCEWRCYHSLKVTYRWESRTGVKKSIARRMKWILSTLDEDDIHLKTWNQRPAFLFVISTPLFKYSEVAPTGKAWWARLCLHYSMKSSYATVLH